MCKGIKVMMVKGLKGFQSELRDSAKTFGSVNFLLSNLIGMAVFTAIIILVLK